MESKTKIVVLGGGYGGVEAAKVLNRRLGRDESVSITLIDRNPYHTLMTELHEVAGFRTEPEAVQISYKRIFGGTKVAVVCDEIVGVDFQAKVLKSGTAEYGYDYLVLGTGGNPEFFGTEGVQENCFTLWSLEDALRIREHVENRFRAAAKAASVDERRHDLTFAVAGAGFTGIELAGELVEAADVFCRKYHIDRNEVRVVVIEAQGSILPILAEKPAKAAMRHLLRKKAEILLNAPIVKAEPGKIHLKDGTVVQAGTFVWTCGIQASDFTAKLALTKGRVSKDAAAVSTPDGIHGLAFTRFAPSDRRPAGERGRIEVNEYLQSVDHDDVYLTGDVVWYQHDGKPVPQVVENALQSAHVVATNIAAAVGVGKKHRYAPNYHGFLVSVGSKYAVAHVMGISLYGYFAMFMKHLVNLHYLWGVAKFNSCWGYLQEEFFQVKHRRSMVGGQLAAKVPAYWVLPLRLWLGLMWVVEGVNKYLEGWLDFGSGSKSGWMFSKGVVQAGGASDATAAASVAASSSDAGAAAWSGLEAAASSTADATAAASAAAPAAGAAAGHAAGLDLGSTILSPDNPLTTWFRQTFMDGIAAHLPYQLFQLSIVGVETAIGLALLAGLFTWPAAALSMVMCLVFTVSGFFAWNQLFYFFAAVALLGGAGRIVGLDYWVLPWLRRFWNGLGWVQRWHLYVDEPLVKAKK